MPPSAGACQTTLAADSPDWGRASNWSSIITAITRRCATAGFTGTPVSGSGTRTGVGTGVGVGSGVAVGASVGAAESVGSPLGASVGVRLAGASVGDPGVGLPTAATGPGCGLASDPAATPTARPTTRTATAIDADRDPAQAHGRSILIIRSPRYPSRRDAGPSARTRRGA